MPPQQGCRGDEEGDPALTRDDPTRRCEEDPIDDPELRSARRPLQHAKLMAEDEDLEVLGPVVSALLATADEETDEGADDEVEEGQHRPIVPGLSERESGFPTLTGYLRGSLTRPATQRQMDVLAALVAAGGSGLHAAGLVGIRPSTAKRHLADLRARSGLTTEQLIYAGRASGRLVVPSLEPH